METINLAFSSILRNRLRSFLTILGIVIGVMSVIILVGLVSGLRSFITDQIASLGPNVMFVIPGKVGGGRGPGGIQTNRLTLQDANTLSSRLQGEAEVSAGIQKVTKTKYKNKTVDDYDYFVFHQANKLMNESIRKKLKIPIEKYPYTLPKYGNTSSASVPLTIVSELGHTSKQKQNLLLAAFGVGLSWGSVSITNSEIEILPLIELE